jgi:hypothetical protein
MCNFGLPYLSSAQLELIEVCKYIELTSDSDPAKDILMQVADKETYVRFKK